MNTELIREALTEAKEAVMWELGGEPIWSLTAAARLKIEEALAALDDVEELLDGYSVYRELSDKQRHYTTEGSVSAVLDAVMKIQKRQGGEVSKKFYEEDPRGHEWKMKDREEGEDSAGEIDTFAFSHDLHNGPECVKCGYSFCEHCANSIPSCYNNESSN